MHERNILKRRYERMMRRQRETAEVWQTIGRLFEFREIGDAAGNTHVLWAHATAGLNEPLNIRPGQYVEFEALENHEHLLDDIEPGQFRELLAPLDSLCRALRDTLAVRCPGRKFRVWGLIQLHGTMLVRFHQDWPDEEPYWPEDMELDAAREAVVFYTT